MSPDFAIIGTEKGGTTWLYDVLRAHPNLFLPDVKEIHYFNRFDSNGREIDNYLRRGPDWYGAHFDGAPPGVLRGEATPLYLSDPVAATRIREALPDGRFIVLLRDPVDRFRSHYRMARAKGHVTASVEELIDAASPEFLGRGLYHHHLSRWLDLFDRDRFLILSYEDVARAPAGVLRKTAAWLGVDAGPLLSAAPERRRNAASGYRSARLYNFGVKAARTLRSSNLTAGVARQMKAAGVYDCLKSMNRVDAGDLELNDADVERLVKFYEKDRLMLGALLEDAPGWAAVSR